jgi:hypothetical protein
MTSKSDTFYIGSCRYMYDFGWNYFRARIYTTREIIYYLENIHTIQKIIDEQPAELIPSIFGDILNKSVIQRTPNFTKEPVHNDIKKLVIEISSRKQYYYGDIPISHCFISFTPDLIVKYDLKYVDLTDEDIENDLKYIMQISKTIFNANVELNVIPHLNLKLNETSDYLQRRSMLVNLLHILSFRMGFKLHNIGKFLELVLGGNAYLNVIMTDHHHYSNNYDVVRWFIKTVV